VLEKATQFEFGGRSPLRCAYGQDDSACSAICCSIGAAILLQKSAGQPTSDSEKV
jgi:hypothetical protein